MTAHDQNEASSRSSITTLTMMSACRNRPRIERSCGTAPPRAVVSMGLPCMAVNHPGGLAVGGGVGGGGLRLGVIEKPGERGAQRRRQARRPALGIETGKAQRQADENALAAGDLLRDRERRAAERGEPRRDEERV